MPMALPPAKELFGGDASLYDRQTGELRKSNSKLVDKREDLVAAVTASTINGLTGASSFDGTHETGAPIVKTARRSSGRKVSADGLVQKGLSPELAAALSSQLTATGPDSLVKEWTLTNPINTGLVPFDLEAPAKLLTPRPTPFRNSVPRLKGQGASRRFKVISGFPGTGTGIATMNPGINESTTNTGPGGLSYIRPPYISYSGYDVTLSYVSWGLSDSVSWQAEYQGQGFEDIRSLSNTALLYATMLMDERLMWYGRGTTGNGYAGALGTPGSVSASVTAGSAAPSGSSTLTAATYWYIVAADGGDLMDGSAFHQGPTTAAASVVVGSNGEAIQLTIGTDVAGALGYNMFVASVSTGPFCYAGRTGYNVGYITAPPSLTAGTASASASDASALATNFDGWLTNVAASGGYVKRLNSTFSTTNPGSEFQTVFSTLYDSVKADPDEIWLNGHDRNQLSNALLGAANVNAYRVFIPNGSGQGDVTAGALVQSIVNQVTGKVVNINVEPWMPQGNAAIRSVTLPIPDSNVSETSVMVLPQDYVAVQWPVQQFTYDASTFEVGTMCHYAPGWQGLLQGIVQSG